jgi:hypothetical protein
VSGSSELLCPSVNVFVHATNDSENGCINLSLSSPDELSETTDLGGFIISKASSKDNFQTWEELYVFDHLSSHYLSKNLNLPIILIKDTDIDFGVMYQYCI